MGRSITFEPDFKRKIMIKEMNGFKYELSEDEIKDGDWCFEIKSFYPTGLPTILQCFKRLPNEILLKTGWRRQISFPQSGKEILKIVSTNNPEFIFN